jgi:hypothetical protein
MVYGIKVMIFTLPSYIKHSFVARARFFHLNIFLMSILQKLHTKCFVEHINLEFIRSSMMLVLAH